MLAGVALAAFAALPWLALAPNRLLPGQPISALAALGWAAPVGVATLGASCWAFVRGRPGAALLLTATGLLVVLLATADGADTLLVGKPSAARVALGSGFWTCFAASILLAFEQARRTTQGLKLAVAFAAASIVAAAAYVGLFDQLSLAVEYRARAGALQNAFLQHLALAAAALVIAAALALPLAAAALRRPRLDWAAGGLLSAVQVTPAIALFGLLIPLVAALLAYAPSLRTLGISAIGPTPALVGIALYLALPLYRGVVTGLRSADADAVEAARAMGMQERQITREVRIPLGIPSLVGALRVAAVQSIGLVTLGGLIGAGGLGAIMFQGMSQLAADLILLGALPVVALGIAADRALSALETFVSPSR